MSIEKLKGRAKAEGIKLFINLWYTLCIIHIERDKKDRSSEEHIRERERKEDRMRREWSLIWFTSSILFSHPSFYLVFHSLTFILHLKSVEKEERNSFSYLESNTSSSALIHIVYDSNKDFIIIIFFSPLHHLLLLLSFCFVCSYLYSHTTIIKDNLMMESERDRDSDEKRWACRAKCVSRILCDAEKMRMESRGRSGWES